MRKTELLIILCWVMSMLPASAQTIHGKLVDKQQQAVAFANIVLQQADSTFVGGTTSNEEGDFRLTKVAAGDYRLVISNLGYQTIYLDLQGFEQSANLGTITLQDASLQLEEVTVTASNLTATADKKMVFPNPKQVKAAHNGIDLLNRLMLPRLNINPMDGSISTNDGGSVQLCINGRKASKEEVTALQPEEIIRVEMEEDPGVRYGDAAVVVNYIVRRYNMGGSFSINGQQSIHTLFGRNNLNGKLNFGKSEISFYYGTNQQFFKNMWAYRNETFVFQDGNVFHRKQEVLPHKAEDMNHWGAITYNLQKDDRYMLNISVGTSHNIRPSFEEKGKLYTDEFPNLITDRSTKEHRRNVSPSLDIYFQKNLKDKQFIALNAVATFIDTNNRNRYQEYLDKELMVDYYSAAQGKKYSLIVEGIYEKQFEQAGKLTGGLKHTQSYTNNSYEGTLYDKTQMKQANTYGYIQYAGKWGRLAYQLGLGITRSWLQQKGQNDYETWSLNPRLLFNLPINSNWSLSLQGNIHTINPSLSELSAVDQLTDSLQIQRGNPTLKPYHDYQTNFRLNYHKGICNIGLFNYYTYRDNAIMGYVYPEKNKQGQEKFVHSYANHPSFQNWRTGIDLRIGMLWEILQLRGKLESNNYWSRGINFSHAEQSIGWEISAMLMYKNFSLMAAYQHNCNYFWGEYLSTGEKIHILQAQYHIKRVNIGVNIFNPFSAKDGYYRDEMSLNKNAGYRYRYYIKDAAQMVNLVFSYNFSFGRDYKSGNKRTSNNDTDSGIR